MSNLGAKVALEELPYRAEAVAGHASNFASDGLVSHFGSATYDRDNQGLATRRLPHDNRHGIYWVEACCIVVPGTYSSFVDWS